MICKRYRCLLDSTCMYCGRSYKDHLTTWQMRFLNHPEWKKDDLIFNVKNISKN